MHERRRERIAGRLADPGCAPRPRPAPELAPQEPPAAPRGLLLPSIRYVLPAAVTLAGVGVMAFGTETDLLGGAGIVSAGIAIYLGNWLVRAGLSGEREREREQAAREYFSRHGRWPD